MLACSFSQPIARHEQLLSVRPLVSLKSLTGAKAPPTGSAERPVPKSWDERPFGGVGSTLAVRWIANEMTRSGGKPSVRIRACER